MRQPTPVKNRRPKVRRHALAFALIVGMFCVTATSTRTAVQGSTAELRALEQVWLQAIQDRDTTTLNRILADDFQDITYDGRLATKADAMGGPVSASTNTETLSDLVVRLYGEETGVVTGVNTVTSTAGVTVARIRFTDVFIRRDGRWLAVSAQETPERLASGARSGS